MAQCKEYTGCTATSNIIVFSEVINNYSLFSLQPLSSTSFDVSCNNNMRYYIEIVGCCDYKYINYAKFSIELLNNKWEIYYLLGTGLHYTNNNANDFFSTKKNTFTVNYDNTKVELLLNGGCVWVIESTEPITELECKIIVGNNNLILCYSTKSNDSNK